MNILPIPGWIINIEEISNGVFKVTLTDSFGHKAEIIGTATDETIEKAIGYAFSIEKQSSQNWNLFLYDLATQKLNGINIQNKEYNNNAFGSWFIENQNKRLVYNGKDSWLTLQAKIKGDWTDIDIIQKDDLKYSHFVRQINRLTNKLEL